MLSKIRYLILVIVLSCSSAVARTIVYGRVTGADGKPIGRANVYLCFPGDDRPMKAVEVRPDGNYSIPIDSVGLWVLHFAGVFHHEYPVAVYSNGVGRIRLDVKLRTYHYGSSFAPAVIGSFNDWVRTRPVYLNQMKDGKYSASINSNSDTIVYRLINVRSGGEVEGTDANRYVPNGIQGYSSVLLTSKREARIIFDPGKLPYSKNRSGYLFASRSSIQSRIAAGYAVLVDAEQNSKSAYFARIVSDKSLGYKFDFGSYLRRANHLLHGEHSKLVRQVIELSEFAIGYMSTRGNAVNPADCRKVLKEIPPNSIVWSLHPSSISDALNFSGLPKYERKDYVREVLDSNPMARTKITLLVDRIERTFHTVTPEDIVPDLSILLDQYGDSPEAISYRRIYSRYVSPKDGDPAPHFSLPSLSAGTDRVSNETFSGRYCLLEFWSQSDYASVQEGKEVQRALKANDRLNLDLVSIELDSAEMASVEFPQIGSIRRFSVQLKDGLADPVCKSFEVYSVPKLVLIGPDGKVMASGWELRGDGLKNLLDNLRRAKVE